MNGDCASRASRRAISVLPTPVGPIIRMFFGVTSSAISCGSRCRRVRLRIAIATARFAPDCPMTYLSSSATIWRGVRASTAVAVRSGRNMAIAYLELFNRQVGVRVDADVGGNGHRLLRNLARRQLAVSRERARRGHRERPAGTYGHDAVIRLDEIAGSRQQEGRLTVGDNHHRLEPA